MKNISLRLDLISKKQFPKNQLFRIVFYNNQLIIDQENKIKARGVYFKKDNEFKIDKKIKALIQRSFKTKISEEQFENLSNALEKRGQYE
ncbi:DUF448 domain-containing protein [Mycoplasma sp. T363T]|uniref:DUF448 domain-containing protein n=1 Tax=Mycoplasma bradburyae TaxID=2963128 RepID=A0AAW6HQC6_9MOLU|nr:YlxR family protein [Mycoplasma bradburyae]MDC4163122.1 DUF448 domain-containing protein [Mycoplasma bradburyae]MDC4183657.1 DUF448 domain-containing protein [Mycoplasma bradburyae]UTS70947.1 DUF448 domain-containing protein [Mycoplasma bradburyae]